MIPIFSSYYEIFLTFFFPRTMYNKDTQILEDSQE